MGKWSGVSKPYTTKDGKELTADRLVVSQPIMFESAENQDNLYNRRKLNELPYHLIRCGDSDTMKKQVVCNFDFVSGKCAAFSAQVTMKL